LAVVIRTKRSTVRFRSSLWEILILLGTLAVGVYAAYRFDFFRHKGAAVSRTIQLDEAFVLVGVLAVGVALFYLRRILERKRAAARELTTEEYVQTPEFQRALAAIANPKPGDTQRPMTSAGAKK